MLEVYGTLVKIARAEYKQIIVKSEIIHKRTVGSAKLRLHLKNCSFLDIWLSATGKYSYHWEARGQSGKIYRHDNAPDFPNLSTFPKHLHNGDEKTVQPSMLSDKPTKANREILEHIKSTLLDS